jgi:hypothetical protein
MRPAEWREDAIAWITKDAANLRQTQDRWKVGAPTDKAREAAIQIIKVLGPDAPAPSALLATPSEGIEIEWRRGNRLLSVEIMPDGTIESLKSISGRPIEEEKLYEPDWRVHDLVAWVNGS